MNLQEMPRERLEAIQDTIQKESSALKSIERLYYEHGPQCEAALDFYNGYNAVMKSGSNEYHYPVQFYSAEQLHEILIPLCEDSRVILVITANKIERGVFLRFLKERFGKKINTYAVPDGAHHGGHDRLFNVVTLFEDSPKVCTIVHTHAPETGDEQVRRCINAAHRLLKPDYVILLGVCYGIDFHEHDIGDVFISDHVIGYRINFRDRENGLEDEVFYEPKQEFSQQPDQTMLKSIRIAGKLRKIPNNILAPCKCSAEPKMTVGKFLSSNCLMSHRKVKEAVVSAFLDEEDPAQGGEMEACGIFKTTLFETGDFQNWLVVKGICDWGEKKNAADIPGKSNKQVKDEMQAYAMVNACAVLEFLLTNNIF